MITGITEESFAAMENVLLEVMPEDPEKVKAFCKLIKMVETYLDDDDLKSIIGKTFDIATERMEPDAYQEFINTCVVVAGESYEDSVPDDRIVSIAQEQEEDDGIVEAPCEDI